MLFSLRGKKCPHKHEKGHPLISWWIKVGVLFCFLFCFPGIVRNPIDGDSHPSGYPPALWIPYSPCTNGTDLRVKAMPYVGFKAFPRFEPHTQRAQRKTKALLSALCRESFNHGGTETRRREKKLFLCVSVPLWLKLSWQRATNHRHGHLCALWFQFKSINLCQSWSLRGF